MASKYGLALPAKKAAAAVPKPSLALFQEDDDDEGKEGVSAMIRREAVKSSTSAKVKHWI